ncbi:hypothetical protein OEB99_06195 [Actinotalea sp. M2MS4P-6]|uniref:hypothetical protein n=1 Tax=Actinotalea sp. M2MS4P-6 TaxID=2983762 RepID=UPI0021E3A434|nr:hypothetical protein [Actinotalea sp. M2MS4P-6]MCV2393892.1 hypothetical protein [Actinotalea sp. M2MS4P-6]
MDLVQVELDDESPSGRPPRVRRRVRVWAGLAAVVVGAVAIVVGVQDRAAMRATERLAAVDGLDQDLTQERSEAWRAEASGVLGVVDDLVLLTRGTGGAAAVAIADGEPVWAHDAGVCSLVDLGGEPVTVRRAALTRVLCQQWRGSPSGGVLGAEVLDSASGAALARVSVVTSGGAFVTIWRDMLVGVGVDLRDRVVAQGWSMVTGDRVWTWTGSAGAVPVADLAHAQGWLRIDSAGGRILLDVESGTVVVTAAEVAQATLVVLPDGGTATTVVEPAGTEVELSGPSGASRTVIRDAAYARPAVDDPLARDVLTLYRDGDRLSGVDAVTGEDLWRLAGRPYRPLASLGGVLVIGYPVRAVDPRTGATLWTSTATTGLLCDGRNVGVLEAGRLVVRELRTGALVAASTLPDGATAIASLPGGRWAVVTDGEVVTFAPV